MDSGDGGGPSDRSADIRARIEANRLRRLEREKARKARKAERERLSKSSFAIATPTQDKLNLAPSRSSFSSSAFMSSYSSLEHEQGDEEEVDGDAVDDDDVIRDNNESDGIDRVIDTVDVVTGDDDVGAVVVVGDGGNVVVDNDDEDTVDDGDNVDDDDNVDDVDGIDVVEYIDVVDDNGHGSDLALCVEEIVDDAALDHSDTLVVSEPALVSPNPRPVPNNAANTEEDLMPADAQPVAMVAAEEHLKVPSGGTEQSHSAVSAAKTGARRQRISSFRGDGIDRSNWKSRVAQRHPEVQDLRDRIYPIDRTVSFSRVYLRSDNALHGDLVNEKVINKLIMQHMHFEGLTQSLGVFEEETGVEYVDDNLSDSRVMSILRIAIRDVERIWDLTMADKLQEHADDELEELLDELQVLEEETLLSEITVWDEEADDESNIVFSQEEETSGVRNTVIAAATLNKLVEKLTSAGKLDMVFTKSMLMTYRSFTTPEKFLKKLMERYNVPERKTRPKDMSLERWLSSVVKPTQLRVVSVLRKWIDEFEEERHNNRLLKQLTEFVWNDIRADHEQLARGMMASLRRKLSDKKRKPKVFPFPPPEPKIPKKIFSKTLTLMDVDDEEIARQLTLLDFETFSRIKPSELLNLSWSKAKSRYRSPNVLGMIERFNNASAWVASLIISEPTIRQRVKVMAKLIKIAGHFRRMNNFNSLMAVIAGLNNAAVHRLKWTREELPRGIISEYRTCERLMKSENAYKEYRLALSQADPPCIPYLGVYLTDLTFVEEGNPDYTAGGLINFTKRRLIYNVVSKIQQYQQLPYHFHSIPQIARLVDDLPLMVADEMYPKSLEIEPRGTTDRSELL